MLEKNASGQENKMRSPSVVINDLKYNPESTPCSQLTSPTFSCVLKRLCNSSTALRTAMFVRSLTFSRLLNDSFVVCCSAIFALPGVSGPYQGSAKV